MFISSIYNQRSMKKLAILFSVAFLLSILIRYQADIIDATLPTISKHANFESKLFNSAFYKKRTHDLLVQFSEKKTYTEILFIGDSHIQKLPNKKMILTKSENLGVAGQTTVGLSNLLNTIKFSSHTKKVVLLIGYNDFKYRNIEETFINIKNITNSIRKKIYIKDKDLYILSLLPVGKNRNITNHKIKKINNLLKELCDTNNMNFLDIYPLFIDKTGNLNQHLFMNDKVHLNHKGYTELTDFLNLNLRGDLQ